MTEKAKKKSRVTLAARVLRLKERKAGKDQYTRKLKHRGKAAYG